MVFCPWSHRAKMGHGKEPSSSHPYLWSLHPGRVQRCHEENAKNQRKKGEVNMGQPPSSPILRPLGKGPKDRFASSDSWTVLLGGLFLLNNQPLNWWEKELLCLNFWSMVEQLEQKGTNGVVGSKSGPTFVSRVLNFDPCPYRERFEGSCRYEYVTHLRIWMCAYIAFLLAPKAL
jgi:hypothetical protein